MKNNIQTIESTNLSWINVAHQGQKETKWLENNIPGLNPLDIKDCLPPSQRPKLVKHHDHIFMILHFPFYNRQTKQIQSSEIDFFIFKNKLITVHANNLEPLSNLFHDYQKNGLPEPDSSTLLYKILHELFHYCYPILNHVSLDIEHVEDKIFEVHDKKLGIIREILMIKRNITNFRKTMQAHKSVLQKFVKQGSEMFPDPNFNERFNSLISHTKDIWDFAQNYRDAIDALQDTHESLATHRLNDIIKTLTIFSVIVFPLTLLAAIFGMNTMNSMPFINSDYDFWIIIGIMFVGTMTMFWFFKRKRWI